MTPENKALMERYPQYYRDVSHLEVIDVYRVIDLFQVTDATAQHALKKLLLSGQRTGGKPIEVDLKEARDTLSRGLAMRAEDANKHQLGFDFAAPDTQSWTPPAVPVLTPAETAAVADLVRARMGQVHGQEYVMPVSGGVEFVGDNGEQLTPNQFKELLEVKNVASPVSTPPAPQQAIRFCAHEGCEMRVRSPEEAHCMIHSGPPLVPPAPPTAPVSPYRHKPGCEEKCAASSCPCQDGVEHPAPEGLKLPSPPVPPAPYSPAASVSRHTR